MLTIQFICNTFIDFYASILLLRAWLQVVGADRYHPFCQMVATITRPLVDLLHRMIPTRGGIDSAALLLAFGLLTLKMPLLALLQSNRALHFQPHVVLFSGLLSLLKTSGRLLFWVLLMRSFFGWTNQGRHPIDHTLQQLTEPLLKPIRSMLPPTSGLDFSPMALMLLLIVLNFIGTDLFSQGWANL